jgi:predicted aspartyl protease
MHKALAAGAVITLISGHAFAEDCGLKQFASLDLIGDPAGTPRVAVSIAGRPFHLIVDTGGVYSLLSPSAVSAVGVDLHDIRNGTEVYDVNGNAAANYVNAKDFQIGAIHLPTLSMIVMQPMADSRVDGLLSPDFLQHFDVDFDFAGRKVNFFSPDHCEGKVVYWAKEYVDAPFKAGGMHIQIEVTLDGHPLTAMIDTGTSISTIDEKVSAIAMGIDKSSPGIMHDAAAKPDDPFSYRYRFKSISLNGLEVRNPELVLLPDLAERAFEKRHSEKAAGDAIYGEHLQPPDIILGTDVLSKLHLYISYKEKKLYFTAADAH